MIRMRFLSGRISGIMAFRNHHFDDGRIPSWLKEHCLRLKDEGMNLRNLNLNIRRLNLPSILALSEALRDNKTIETVNLTTSLSNTQNDQDANRILMPFAYALRHHVSLKTVHLSYNQLTNATSLGTSLEMNQSSLTELHLDHNRLNNETAFALARALQRNDKLSVLQLNSNNLGDEGGEMIAKALRYNSTLKSLGLARNSLESKTASALFETLDFYGNVSLVHLSLNDNPDFPLLSKATIMYLVRANRAGRYLLRDNYTKSSDIDSYDTADVYDDSANNGLSRSVEGKKVDLGCFGKHKNRDFVGIKRDYRRGLWPLVLEGLEPNMMYFFVRENPNLMHFELKEKLS